jgi:hypothetical protein
LKKQIYSLKDAAALIKVVASAFDESVDIAVRWVIQEKRIKW